MSAVNNKSVYDEVYTLQPKSLQDICLKSIVAYINQLTSFKLINEKDENCRKQTFFIQNIELPCRLAERILETISLNGSLINDTLSIFSNPSKYSLKSVKLHELNMNLAGRALLEYSPFRLKSLHLGCTTVLNCWSVKKLKASFIDSSETLTSLRLELNPGVSIASGGIFEFFTQFVNLTHLYYDTPIQGNNAVFTNKNWELLLTKCSQLKVLYCNINGSANEVELDSSLFLTSKNLCSLTLRSIYKSEVALQKVECIRHFAEMNNLKFIDLSIDSDPNDINQPFQFYNQEGVQTETRANVLGHWVAFFLISGKDKLPLLESLDLSGIFHMVDNELQAFVDSHPNLGFLGLCMVNSKFCISNAIAQKYSHITISGCQLEEQIIHSLLMYSNRPYYMREVLKGLFQVSSTWDKRRPYILKLVMDIMKKFTGFQQIQLAATACLFHLSKERDKIENELNNIILSEMAKVTMMVLANYIGNLQMVKNCLLIICTDRILQNASFDRVRMSRICLSCMINYNENVDNHVTRMAVAIVSILACKITSKETANLINEKEMKLLLDICEVRIERNHIDSTLKFNLSALWNLTDESPQASKLFFDLGGLIKYVKMLEIFIGNNQIETRVLGLLNNIAEVKFLHEVLVLNEDLILSVKRLISSSNIPVSYFACGIVANLGLYWDKYRSCLTERQKAEILDDLQSAIDRFGVLDHEIVTYRSFKPFHELLESHDKPQIQHWAVWAIHHVCTLGSQYKSLMDDNCWGLLSEVHKRTASETVRGQINSISKSLDYKSLLT